jgi:hypothetical protein
MWIPQHQQQQQQQQRSSCRRMLAAGFRVMWDTLGEQVREIASLIRFILVAALFRNWVHVFNCGGIL